MGGFRDCHCTAGPTLSSPREDGGGAGSEMPRESQMRGRTNFPLTLAKQNSQAHPCQSELSLCDWHFVFLFH